MLDTRPVVQPHTHETVGYVICQRRDFQRDSTYYGPFVAVHYRSALCKSFDTAEDAKDWIDDIQYRYEHAIADAIAKLGEQQS